MQKCKKYGFILSILFLAGPTFASVPHLMNYQGRLTDSEGTPITSPTLLTFSFWDAESGGSSLGQGFTDSDTIIPDENGLYSTLIGDDPDNPIPQSIFLNDDVWLNVNVEGEDLLPRKRITSSAYALHTASAQSIDHRFPIAAGETIQQGNVVALQSDGTIRKGSGNRFSSSAMFSAGCSDVQVVALSDKVFAIAYQDKLNYLWGRIVIGKIINNSIVYTSDTLFNEGRTYYISLIALDSSHILVVYVDGENANRGIARIFSYSGTTLTGGSPTVFNPNYTCDLVCDRLSDNQAVIAYSDGGNAYSGTVAIAEASGTSLDFSTHGEQVFNTAITREISVAAFSDTQFALVYRDEGNSDQGTFLLGDLSATPNLFSESTEVVFHSEKTIQNTIAALPGGRFIIGFLDMASHSGMFRMGDMATAPSYFTTPSSNLTGSDCLAMTISALTDGKMIVLYTDGQTEGKGKALIGDLALDPDYFASDTGSTFSTSAIGTPAVTPLSASRFIVGYPNSTEGGWAVIGEVTASLSLGQMIGIATEDGQAGDTVAVSVGGIANNLTGLTPGTVYYALPDGTISDQITPVRMGRALSNSDLLFQLGP